MSYLIKKGRLGTRKFPRLLKRKTQYTREFTVTKEMFTVNDKCDTGWNKLWGMYYFYIHYSSFRFGFRITNGELLIASYIYNDFISPQENAQFKKPLHLGKISVGDIIILGIEFNKSVTLTALNKTTKVITSNTHRIKYSLDWIVFEANPNLKCKAITDISFNLKQHDELY